MTYSPAHMADLLRTEAKEERGAAQQAAGATIGTSADPQDVRALAESVQKYGVENINGALVLVEGGHIDEDDVEAVARAYLAAEQRATAAERERDGWQESAREFANGLEFYRGIVQQTGAHFGVAAYTSDDGSVQDSVLALKVPELALAVVERLERAEAENDRMRDVTLPALRLSLETEILPGLKASAQVRDTQRAEMAVRWLIAALAAGQPVPSDPEAK